MEKLNKAPLVEAILEIRWKLTEQGPGLFIDPEYKLFVGRFYDKLSTKFGVHEMLPSASMPDEMASHIVQHRFRVGEGNWPLVQVGPGVITVNDTENYSWNEFKDIAQLVVKSLFEAYPDSNNKLCIEGLQLRYIDAINFNYENDDILNFVSENLKIGLKFPSELFDGLPVSIHPEGVNSLFVFSTEKPKGKFQMRFARGIHNDNDALIWETIVSSGNEGIPEMPDNFHEWLTNAHDITHDMFFKLIKGNLEEKFK